MNPDAPSSSEIEATIQGLLSALPEPYATEARSFARPVTLAKPFRSLQTIAPDVSCLSGAALLAPGESWPARDGKPLTFLARINFADLPATPFQHPAHGAVEIFFDTENSPWGHDAADAPGHAILFHPDSSGLKPALAPGSGAHPPLRKPLAFSQAPEFTPSSDFEDRYQDLLQTLDDATGETVDDFYQTLSELQIGEGHRVLSLPLVIQSDMDEDLADAARVRGLPEDTPWTLLLQLDSDPTLKWSWGDSGYLYFWVPTEDLAAGRFDRSWVVLQCN